MSDIFLSYAREDREKAKLLADGLAEQGWSVWWDRRIVPGKFFDQVIEHEISLAKCVVVLWSKSSITSDWVRSEAEEGRDRRILIPVLIEPTRVPMAYRNIQAADLSSWDGDYRDQNYQELVHAVTTLVPRIDAPASNISAPTPIQPSTGEDVPSRLEIEEIEGGNANAQPALAGTPPDRPTEVNQNLDPAEQVVGGDRGETSRPIGQVQESPSAAEDAPQRPGYADPGPAPPADPSSMPGSTSDDAEAIPEGHLSRITSRKQAQELPLPPLGAPIGDVGRSERQPQDRAAIRLTNTKDNKQQVSKSGLVKNRSTAFKSNILAFILIVLVPAAIISIAIWYMNSGQPDAIHAILVAIISFPIIFTALLAAYIIFIRIRIGRLFD